VSLIPRTQRNHTRKWNPYIRKFLKIERWRKKPIMLTSVFCITITSLSLFAHSYYLRAWSGILFLCYEVTRRIATPPLSPLDRKSTTGYIPSMSGSITTPPGWDASLSQDTQYKVTRSIYYSPSVDGMLVPHRIPSIKWLGVLKYYSPLGRMPVYDRIPSSIKWLGVLLLPLGWDARFITGYSS